MGNSRQAFKFLEISAFIYTLSALSTAALRQPAAGAGDAGVPRHHLVDQPWPVLCDGAAQVPLPRSSREFLVVNSYFIGYTLPIYSAIFLLQIASAVLGGLLLLATIVPLWIYMLRVHKAFWQLRGRTILLYLFVSSFTGGIVGTVFLVAVMLLTRQDAYSTY